MLKQVANGVLVHKSDFMQSNAVVVQGKTGVLLVDAGLTRDELASIAHDLRELDLPMVAGFSTHPHWDHLLWHADFGDAPRYGTAGCAAMIEAVMANPQWQDRVHGAMPSDLIDKIPLELFGEITGLPEGATEVPWDGPKVRVIEHQAHAPGHAALLIEENGVLVAGDMLSDLLVPMLNLMNAADPTSDYLAGLNLLEGAADQVKIVIPGHGSVGGADDMRARVKLDQAYVQALRDGEVPDDPRIGPQAKHDWVNPIHDRQVQQLAHKNSGD